MDDSPISRKGTRPKQGGVVTIQPPIFKGQSVFEAVIEPGNWLMVVLENGKQVYLDHSVVSKDGRTGHSTIRGTDAKSKPFEGLIVWEKQ
jgi:hypothetical protein